jgi:hypothetical protein
MDIQKLGVNCVLHSFSLEYYPVAEFYGHSSEISSPMRGVTFLVWLSDYFSTDFPAMKVDLSSTRNFL